MTSPRLRYSTRVESADDRVRLRFEDGDQGDRTLATGEVHALWKTSDAFCLAFSAALAEAPYEAFFWETPSVTSSSLGEPFECVLTSAPVLGRQPADPRPFADRFAAGDGDAGIVSFYNLGGDAELVVPRDLGAGADHAHLAGFLRTGPERQKRALWRRVSECADCWLEASRPFWISTSGLGVAWVHVRLDSRPKYYVYAPYLRF